MPSSIWAPIPSPTARTELGSWVGPPLWRRHWSACGSALTPAGRDDRAVEVRAGHGTVVRRVTEGIDVTQPVRDPVAAVIRRDIDGGRRVQPTGRPRRQTAEA